MSCTKEVVGPSYTKEVVGPSFTLSRLLLCQFPCVHLYLDMLLTDIVILLTKRLVIWETSQ